MSDDSTADPGAEPHDTASPVDPPAFRILPHVSEEEEPFWTGGADGELRLLRCQDCGWWLHPSGPLCPRCLGRSLAAEATSGHGTVHAFTINHQPWIPGFDPPYVVAIVELPEQPGLRVTTNVVGCDPDAVATGMAVEVRFERHDAVWVPLFVPSSDAPSADARTTAGTPDDVAAVRSSTAPERPGRATPRRARTVGERAATISGIGQSQIGRRIYRDPVELTVDAALAAIEDAGLTRDDIDGVSTYPGNMSVPPGFSGVGVTEIQEALRLELDWFSGGMETPGQFGAVVNAAAAVAAGLADHVLCFRTVWEASAQGGGGRSSVTMGGGGGDFKASGFIQWTLPFGAASAANWIGMMAQRHMHEFGTTREQLAQVALNGRANAARNPNAIYRDPMTLDDYLAARMVSWPFCLYDCDVPADGSTAVIVSRADAADDLRRPPVRIEAIGTALHGRPSWDQFDDLTTMALRDASAMLWERTDLTPANVDVAELYDGFSFITLCWLEALGFCAKGEGGPWLAEGRPMPDGSSLPLNTHGGQLSAGRLHGFGFLHEACAQLWGTAGERQLDETPEVAVAAAGGGPLAGALLLTR